MQVVLQGEISTWNLLPQVYCADDGPGLFFKWKYSEVVPFLGGNQLKKWSFLLLIFGTLGAHFLGFLTSSGELYWTKNARLWTQLKLSLS